MTIRKEILDSVNTPMPPPKYKQSKTGSPTLSTTRVRWQQLTEWTSLNSETLSYLQSLPPEEFFARVVNGDYRAAADLVLSMKVEPGDESSLRPWVDNIYFFAHNIAAKPVAAAHPHAKILEAVPAQFPHAGKCDYLFVHEGRPCGVVELKTYWKVTPKEIDEVLDGTAPVSGKHWGRLAIEQTYGYMVHNKHAIGIMTTMNGWVFLSRTEYGELFITRMIPCDVRNPSHCTIFQILYYISALAGRCLKLYERYGNGERAKVKGSDGSRPIAAPVAPGRGSFPPPPEQEDHSTGRTEYLPPVPPFRRHTMEHWTDMPEFVFEPWRAGNTLGDKTFLLTVLPTESESTERVVVAKMWDGYKERPDERDNEVSIYMKLQTLWGGIVPTLIGSAQIDFFISLLIERVDGIELCAANLDDEVSINVKDAFAKIHALGVIHGDVRKQNIMVKEDKSVVIIDFESSVYYEVLEGGMVNDENDEIDRVLKQVKREGLKSPKAVQKKEL